MASVSFFKYYCQCGQFLFLNSDIVDNTHFCKRNYIFINDRANVQIHQDYGNVVKCNTCNSSLGGNVYRKYFNQSNLVRFCGHLLERSEVFLNVYQIIDEIGAKIDGEFFSTLTYGKRISRCFNK